MSRARSFRRVLPPCPEAGRVGECPRPVRRDPGGELEILMVTCESARRPFLEEERRQAHGAPRGGIRRAAGSHRNPRAAEAPGGAAPCPIQRPWRSLGAHGGHWASPGAGAGGKEDGDWVPGLENPRSWGRVLTRNRDCESQAAQSTRHTAWAAGHSAESPASVWKRPVRVVARRARRRPLPPLRPHPTPTLLPRSGQ